jgi:peptidoglycan hydrolase-like protein with peptidoglycan-binding domain
MTLSRNAKIAIYSIPVLVGVYLIYRQFSKAKVAKQEPPKDTPPQPKTPTLPTQPTGKDSFPLKNGSRDAGAPYAPAGRVVALQKMINIKGYDSGENTMTSSTRLKEDGIFGPKTEEAVFFWIDKKSVDNESDWNAIFRKVAPYIAAPEYDPYRTITF